METVADLSTITERMLRRLLTATNRKDAGRQVDWIYNEFLDTVVRRVLTEELRREAYTSTGTLYDGSDTFHDLALEVRSKVSRRLIDLWEERHAGHVQPADRRDRKTIRRLPAYVAVTSRNVCADFLRRKYPGRHALDNALRVALQRHAALALWHAPTAIDVAEWRCGRQEWMIESRPPAVLQLTPSLRQSLEGLKHAQALVRIFEETQAPVRFTQLLTVLSDYWEVETPHLWNPQDRSPIHVPKPYQSGSQPEEIVDLLGTLQSLWPLVRQLAAPQAAVLLLKLPMRDNRSYLHAFAAFSVADWPEIANVTGLSVESLTGIAHELPLDDDAIAELLKVMPQDVTRIRQDARRRLERMQGRSKGPFG